MSERKVCLTQKPRCLCMYVSVFDRETERERERERERESDTKREPCKTVNCIS